MAHGGRQNADAALVASLATGATVQAAAKAAGVGARTVHRRLDDPAFRQRVAHARDELVAQAVGRLSEATSSAVTALLDLLDSEMDFARLGAARAILELAAKYREAADLTERIRALEERLAEAAPATGKGARPWAS